MSTRSQEWLERIENAAGELSPVYVDLLGYRRFGTLDEAQARLNAPTWKPLKNVRVQLCTLEAVDPHLYLAATGFRHASSDGHQIFKFKADGYIVYAPAIVLIHALLGGRLTGFGRFLLTSNGLSDSAIPILNSDGLSVRMNRKTGIERPYQETVSFQSYMRWLVSYTSARRMWFSVYHHASHGRISLDFPSGDMVCSMAGIVRSGVLYAMKIIVSQIITDEIPLPFAKNLISSTSVLFRPTTFASKLEWCRKSEPLCDKLIASGPAGYKLTDSEWHQLRHSFPIGRNKKRTLDGILLKLGSGETWRTAGASDASQALYARLRKQGQWPELREAINALRRSS